MTVTIHNIACVASTILWDWEASGVLDYGHTCTCALATDAPGHVLVTVTPELTPELDARLIEELDARVPFGTKLTIPLVMQSRIP